MAEYVLWHLLGLSPGLLACWWLLTQSRKPAQVEEIDRAIEEVLAHGRSPQADGGRNAD